MKQVCIDSVQAAAKAMGRARPLTAAQLADIDSRLGRTLRQLASTDPDWQAKSTDQRYLEAATRAMEDVKAEAARKLENAQRQAIKTVATQNRLESILEQHPKLSHAEVLGRDMTNIDNTMSGLKVRTMTSLIDLIDAVKNRDGTSFGRRAMMFLFDAEKPGMTHDLVREIYANADGHTGNDIAKIGAKAWISVMDGLRRRFNAAGGDVGKLDYGWVPIGHDFRKVRSTNNEAAATRWVSKVSGLVDRSRYVDETGKQLSDTSLASMLRGVWETIKSDGMNKQEPGQFKGSGARANHGSEARVLHFRDGDAYLSYMSAYGKGGMYDLMTQHVGKMARDITLLENYGPNPNAQMRLQFDLAQRGDGGEAKRFGFGVGMLRVDAEGVWRTLNGEASSPKSEMGAAFFQHVRNVQSLKLAGTFLKMFPDLGTYFLTTGFNKLGYWNAIANLGRSGTSAGREFAAMHGLMADSALRELNRFMGENIGKGWSARLSNSQMKLTLGETWTNWLDRAFGLTKMGALGRMAGTDWSAMDQFDRALMVRAGITESDWGVVRAATLDKMNDVPMLTPDSIVATGHPEAQQVADKILGFIRNQTADAVIKPDLFTRAAQTWNGTQAGTGLGEIARAVMQFKSFPIAMITRHWRLAMEAPKVTDGSAPALANPLLYLAGLGTSVTILGAISNQATAIASGKDPIDMTGPHALKAWLAAFATGGAGGFYADLLTRDSSQDRSAQDPIGKALGPSASDAANIIQLTKGNIDDRLAGKKTHAAAEALQLVRQHTPYVNMWYAKAAIDHAGMQSLQENLSPGYLSKMRKAAQKDWGERYWWAPGSGGPQRPPNLGAAVGG